MRRFVLLGLLLVPVLALAGDWRQNTSLTGELTLSKGNTASGIIPRWAYGIDGAMSIDLIVADGDSGEPNIFILTDINGNPRKIANLRVYAKEGNGIHIRGFVDGDSTRFLEIISASTDSTYDLTWPCVIDSFRYWIGSGAGLMHASPF